MGGAAEKWYFANILKAGVGQKVDIEVGARKAVDALREVFEGIVIACHPAADFGDYVLQMKAVQMLQQRRFRCCEVDEAKRGAGFEEAEHFAQGLFFVVDIAEAVGHGGGVEGVGGEGKDCDIGLKEGLFVEGELARFG